MAQRERAQHPGQAPASSDAVEKPHEGEQLGWAQLDKGLLPIVASRLHSRSVGPGRLVCRQWAAELPQGCTRLQVKGPGPEGWEHRFCGLGDLKWRRPSEYAGPLWPKLRTLTLEQCEDVDLCMLKDLPGLASLNLSSCSRITDAGLKELKPPGFPHPPQPALLPKDHRCGAEGAQAPGFPHLTRFVILRRGHRCGA